MYLEYYGLKREPFHITPDPSFLYLSPSHKEALGAIIYGVEKRKGFIAIIGEVGVGKTSILRAYLERKASQKQKTIYIFNPVLSFHELLISMFRSLELTPRQNNIPEMVNQLHEALIAEYQAGGTVVVAIDEAQNMPIETLENLRMFSNLETSTDKLIQIILLGQPELDELLQQSALRQLKQRIVLWATISPLTQEESLLFIEHRIARACTTGAALLFSNKEDVPLLFTKSALNLIARKAKGIPRSINILCDNALITGFGRQCKPVSVSVVKEIIRDIDTNRASEPYLNVRRAVGFSVAILLLAGVILFLNLSWRNNSLVEIPSTVTQGDADASGRDLSSPKTSAEIAKQTQSRNTDLLVNQDLINDAGRDEKNIGSHGEGSMLGSDAQLQVGFPIVPQPRSDSDEQPGISPESETSKLKRGDSKTSIIAEGEISESKKALYRKTFNSLENGPTSTLDEARKERIVLESRATIPLVKGKSFREVREGESLSQIAMEAYGSQSEKYLEWVKRHNPQIVNPDLILPGQNIALPIFQNNKESQ